MLLLCGGRDSSLTVSGYFLHLTLFVCVNSVHILEKRKYIHKKIFDMLIAYSKNTHKNYKKNSMSEIVQSLSH